MMAAPSVSICFTRQVFESALLVGPEEILNEVITTFNVYRFQVKNCELIIRADLGHFLSLNSVNATKKNLIQ
jgi:RNA:NAD 2'-phosphotransferase (TPT1/KptA family)